MGEAENHLGISHQKMNFSGQGRFRYNQLLAKEIPVETPKQSRLLSRLLIAPPQTDDNALLLKTKPT